jgi:hypothetical protein
MRRPDPNRNNPMSNEFRHSRTNRIGLGSIAIGK